VEGFSEQSNEPSGSIQWWEFLSSCATGDISRRTQLHGVSSVSRVTEQVWTAVGLARLVCIHDYGALVPAENIISGLQSLPLGDRLTS
jgi:hypothetical protein